VPAALARKLASCILTETMVKRPDIGFDSYDRFIPNQDTLPQSGLGNLIALPLQKESRTRGNSLFLDDLFVPYQDQWAFLASVRKIGLRQAEEIVRQAESQGGVIGVRLVPTEEEDDRAPWSLSPSRRRKEPHLTDLPEVLELVLDDQVYLAKQEFPPGLCNRLLRLAAFQNPEFYKAQAMRRSTYNKPRIIACAEDYPHHIGLPRGCLEDVTLLLELQVRPEIRDERCPGMPLPVTFQGELRPGPIRQFIAVIVERTGCCRKTGISSSVSLPKISAVTSTRCWTASCGFWSVVIVFTCRAELIINFLGIECFFLIMRRPQVIPGVCNYFS